jgi:hypothetical protein
LACVGAVREPPLRLMCKIPILRNMIASLPHYFRVGKTIGNSRAMQLKLLI